DLLPLSRPGPGQQYAFEVDLDVCTGCKACVAACHSLNGLDDTELWRTVGLLHGGTPEAPAQQTVTTSCHHCVDPACLNGRPVPPPPTTPSPPRSTAPPVRCRRRCCRPTSTRSAPSMAIPRWCWCWC